MTRLGRILLTGALAAGLTHACIEIPVSGRNQRDELYTDYRRYPEEDYGWYPETEQEHAHYPCSKIDERIRNDRAKIAEIDPSKHHKALQWYKDDLSNAERDKAHCRAEERERAWDGEHDHERERERERERVRERERDHARAQAECEKIKERIRFDQAKLAQIPAEQHKKAAQWYRDDIRNAERDLKRCRR